MNDAGVFWEPSPSKIQILMNDAGVLTARASQKLKFLMNDAGVFWGHEPPQKLNF